MAFDILERRGRIRGNAGIMMNAGVVVVVVVVVNSYRSSDIGGRGIRVAPISTL